MTGFICGIDPFCCEVVWDSICVSEANDICVPDICTPGPLNFTAEPVIEGGRGYDAYMISKDPGANQEKE